MKFFCRLVVKVKKKYLGYTTEKNPNAPIEVVIICFGVAAASYRWWRFKHLFFGRASLIPR